MRRADLIRIVTASLAAFLILPGGAEASDNRPVLMRQSPKTFSYVPFYQHTTSQRHRSGVGQDVQWQTNIQTMGARHGTPTAPPISNRHDMGSWSVPR